MTTPVSSILLVLLASLIGSLAMVLLKVGADRHRRKQGLVQWLSAIGCGIALFLISSVIYLFGIKDGSVALLFPMLSTGYVWALLWSRLFFGEPFNRHKFIGVGLVVAGVFFIGLGKG